MEIKKTQRSNYLKCKHIYCDEKAADGTLMSDITNEWARKVNTTRQKMKNIIREDGQKHKGVLLTSFTSQQDFLTDKERIQYLMHEMGVFWVPAWHQRAKEMQSYLWYRKEPDFPVDSKGNEWYDYYGDSSITQSGGLVVVLLSDEGVEYMNRLYRDIRFLVPHCSYTTTE